MITEIVAVQRGVEKLHALVVTKETIAQSQNSPS